MRILLTLIVWLTCLCAPLFAQSPACVPNTTPERIVLGGARLSFVVSPDHSANDPSGAALLTDYLAELHVQGQAAVVTTFTVPKTSLSPVQGGPSGCHDMALPAMQGLLPTNLYTITLLARGPGGQAPAATSGPFFLAGAPRAPGNTRVFTPAP